LKIDEWLTTDDLELSRGGLGQFGQIALALGIQCVLSGRVFWPWAGSRGWHCVCASAAAGRTRSEATIDPRIVGGHSHFAAEIADFFRAAADKTPLAIVR
jgi:hypothetical protein